VFAAADPREAVNVVHRAEGRSVRESGGGQQPAVRSCGELATQACSVAVRSSNTWRSSLNASTAAAQDLVHDDDRFGGFGEGWADGNGGTRGPCGGPGFGGGACWSGEERERGVGLGLG
jgi:hypothetical protein